MAVIKNLMLRRNQTGSEYFETIFALLRKDKLEKEKIEHENI